MQQDQEKKTRLAQAVWQGLADTGWAGLSVASCAEQAGLEASALGEAGSKLSLVLGQLRHLEEGILAGLAVDLAEAGEADIQERLLEGLMQRFEMLAPHRPQFDALHRASLADPVLAACLGAQLYEAIDKMLWLCGDQQGGLKRVLRVKGVMALLVRLRPIWQKDDSPSLERTLKSLDMNLGKARDWAISLHILDDQNDQGGQREAENG